MSQEIKKTTAQIDDVELIRAFRKSSIFFIEKMWGLKPQPYKPEFKEEIEDIIDRCAWGEMKPKFFGDWIENLGIWEWYAFEKGKHTTWQQWVILLAIDAAINGRSKKRISVVSGHGTGKSAVLSWLMFWFLFCFKEAQVPCTAPTTEQMYDVLWKEASKWQQKLPDQIKSKFEITSDRIEVTESPKTWFARAKTARKENPEALAGIHGEHVMVMVDEGSGVPEEVYNTAEGALTNQNILVLIISNGTRVSGYFYDTHHSDSLNWQNIALDSEQSPIVDKQFVRRIVEKHGIDSDEYRFRVKGLFPKVEGIDDQGYLPLLLESDLRFTTDTQFSGMRAMGIDPAGEGKDESVWVVRDNFKAKIVGIEKVSNEKTIAQKTITLMTEHGVKKDRVNVDNFGVGANVSAETAGAGEKVNGINVGDGAKESDRFENLRAELYWKLRTWLRSGGELVGTKKDWEQLLSIKYRRNLSGKIAIMGKKEMRKHHLKSPDRADALALTFISELVKEETTQYQQPDWEETWEGVGG